MAYISTLACMFEGNCTDVTLCVNLNDGVFIQIFGFLYTAVAELNVQGVSVFEVADFHDLCPLSKNALCTVSPSDNKITRRYRFSISSILAHRLIRPSACMYSFSGNRTTR